MANKININNYEAFLLDHMEGNLSTEDLVALQMFAAQHPELNIDLNDLELVELETEKVSFNGKNDLKKVSDEQFVAYIENQLSEEEKNSVDAICADNKTLATDLKLYKATIAAADETIVFENKSSLKRTEAKVLWLFSREVLAAAASLVLLLGLWFIFRGALTDGNFNSQKIEGISKIKTVAFKNTVSTPSFTIDPVNGNFASTKIATVNYALKNKNKVTPKEETLKEETPQLVNNVKENKQEPQKEITPVTNTVSIDNTPSKLASNTSNSSKPYIITEEAFDKDEVVASNTTKKGFWSKAMKALNGLNKIGVKKAKGTEAVQPNNEQYVLTLGNFKVENNKYKN